MKPLLIGFKSVRCQSGGRAVKFKTGEGFDSPHLPCCLPTVSSLAFIRGWFLSRLSRRAVLQRHKKLTSRSTLSRVMSAWSHLASQRAGMRLKLARAVGLMAKRHERAALLVWMGYSARRVSKRARIARCVISVSRRLYRVVFDSWRVYVALSKVKAGKLVRAVNQACKALCRRAVAALRLNRDGIRGKRRALSRVVSHAYRSIIRRAFGGWRRIVGRAARAREAAELLGYRADRRLLAGVFSSWASAASSGDAAPRGDLTGPVPIASPGLTGRDSGAMTTTVDGHRRRRLLGAALSALWAMVVRRRSDRDAERWVAAWHRRRTLRAAFGALEDVFEARASAHALALRSHRDAMCRAVFRRWLVR